MIGDPVFPLQEEYFLGVELVWFYLEDIWEHFFFQIGTLLAFAGDDALFCRGLVLCVLKY